MHKGYNGIYKKELINDVTVYRFLEIPLEIKGAIRPLINYLSFAFTSIFSIPLIFKSKIIILSSPPIFSIYFPFLMAKLFKKKVVLDIRDLWPESLVELGYLSRNSFIYKLLNNINIIIFNYSNLITTISNELNKEISKKTQTKIKTISNFAKKEYIKLKTEKIKIVYLGRLTEVYNILDYINVISILDNIEIHIIGDGDLKEKILEFVNNTNVFYYGYLNKNEFKNIIEECNIGLIPLKDIKINKEAFPSKSFDYLSYGLPIIFNTSLELKELNYKFNFGWYVDEPNHINIEKVLSSIKIEGIKSKSINAKKLFEEKFEESIVCDKLYQLIQSL